MLASLNSVSACAWAHSPGLTHLPRQHTWRVQTFCQSKGKDQGKDRRTKRSGLAQLLANVLGLPPPGWYQSLSDAVASVQSQQQDFQSQQQDFQSQLQTFQSQINGVESQLKVDIPQMKADLAAVVNNQSASAEAAVRRQLSQTHRWRSDLCAAASIRTAGDAAKLLSGQLGFAELACIDQWLANVTVCHVQIFCFNVCAIEPSVIGQACCRNSTSWTMEHWSWIPFKRQPSRSLMIGE